MLGASLANFLHYQHYPLGRGEVGLVAAGLAAVAAAMAALHAAGGRGWRAAMTGLLAFAAIDLNADRLWLAGIAGAAAAAFAWRRGGEALRFLTVGFAVVLATALAGLGGQAAGVAVKEGKTAAAAAGRPLLVELILDEQAGPRALAPEEARWLEARYKAIGFSVYSDAYSRHYHTKNSLQSLARGEGGMAVWLDRLGYRARLVTETDYYPLCAALRASRCTTYSASSLAPVAAAALPAAAKAELIAYQFGGLSTAVRKVTNAYDKLARKAGWATVELRSARKLPQVNAIAMVPRVEGELRAARAGEFHAVHLLLPHAPFSYDGQCRLLPPRAWRTERGDAPLAERDAAYARQMRCAARVVERLVGAVAASPGGGSAVIIVHGDHGSRIVANEPFGDKAARASEDDMWRAFATLVAVRIPGQAPASVGGQAALAEIVAGLGANRFARLPRPRQGAAWVEIDDEAWRPAGRRALPHWQEAVDHGRAAPIQ